MTGFKVGKEKAGNHPEEDRRAMGLTEALGCFRLERFLSNSPILRVSEEFAERVGRVNSIQDVPHSSAAVGIFGGVPRARIGLLRHVCLSRAQLTGGKEIPIEGESTEILRVAREIRRQVIRQLFGSPKGVPYQKLCHVLRDALQEFEDSTFNPRTKTALATSLGKCQSYLSLQTAPKLSREIVAETFAILLGELREVACTRYSFELDSPSRKLLPGDDEVCILRNSIRARMVYAGEAASRLERREDGDALQHAVKRLRSPVSTQMAEWYEPGAGRSSPVRFLQAARRSIAGVHIGFVQVLDERVNRFIAEPSKLSLLAVSEVLSCWKGAEGRGQYESGVAPNYLARGFFSVPGSGKHSIFRDVVAPAISWAANNFEELPKNAMRDVSRLCQHTLECLTALSVFDTAEFYSGSINRADVKMEQEAERMSLVARGLSKIKALFPSTRSPEPYLHRYAVADWKSLSTSTARDISKFFRRHPDATLNEGLPELRRLTSWSQTYARMYIDRCSFAEQSHAVWAAEFDFADGSIIPHELEESFVALQEQYRVQQGSRASGFIEPETVEWLHEQVYSHDGVLLSVSTGEMSVPLTTRAPYGLCVLTFSQKNPSNLMRELQHLAKDFLAQLPEEEIDGSIVNTPAVLAELVVAGRDGKGLLSSFGELPYQVLNDQSLFNIVSRFPYHPRVDVLAICLEGSVAMKAHERFGWIKTGAKYIDERGSRFDVIHRSVRPAAILLGYRDLSSPE